MSKLIKQFQTIFNNTTINQNRVDASVKIANAHAIEFAEWINSNYGRNGNEWVKYEKDGFKYFTTEQLLKIFNEGK